MNDNFLEIISAKSGERRDLFLAAATRLDTVANCCHPFG